MGLLPNVFGGLWAAALLCSCGNESPLVDFETETLADTMAQQGTESGEPDLDTSDTAGVDASDAEGTDTDAEKYCAWDVYTFCCSDEKNKDTAICRNWTANYQCHEAFVCCTWYFDGAFGNTGLDACTGKFYDFCWFDGEDNYCGDGVFLEEMEACDDWNFEPGDGCYRCKIEPGFVCPVPERFDEPCVRIYECGNGRVETLEVCDDGNTDSKDGCRGDCLETEAGFHCLEAGRPCVSEAVCAPDCPVCGNGVVEPGEQCDDGMNLGAYGDCAPGCVLGPRCGNGVVQVDEGEACDDVVMKNQYAGCAPGCVLGPHCGDGIVQPVYEVCDDGPDNGTYGRCNGSCSGVISCGDGMIQPEFESCDNGADMPNPFCDAACRCKPLKATH